MRVSLFSNRVSTKRPTGRLPGRPTKKTPQAVARMLATARSGLPLKFVAQADPITSKEDKPEFWFQFASGSGERTVSKEVAIYAAATIVNEAVSPYGRGNQAIVAFKTEPITVSDVLSVIERLSGGPFPVPTEISYPPGNWTFTKWTIGGDSFTGYSLDAILAGVRGKGWEL